MLAFTIKEKEISITVKTDLLRGTVGAKCKVKFENFWNKYNKTIVFKRVSSGCSKPFKVIVNAMESTIEIPWEILVESGAFQIGAYGVTENEVLPTLWSEEIKIEYATDTNGETPKPYSLNEIEQLKLQKQNKLTAGANIVIDENNVISSVGGGGGSGIVVDTTYNPDSYNAQSGVALSKAFYTKVEVETKAEELAEYLLDGMVGETLLNEELSKKADLSNKVTNIDENSTDEQYPSAKAVYTALTQAINTAIGEALAADY